MRRSQVSQLIQMGSIGIPDTAPVDSPCHPEDLAANLANVKRGLKCTGSSAHCGQPLRWRHEAPRRECSNSYAAISTRAKFASAETSRDLREADDPVRVLNQ